MYLLISSKLGYFYACIPFYSHRAAVSSLYWSQLGPLLFAFLLGDIYNQCPIKYGVNQRCKRKQCWYLTSSVVDQDDRLHQVDQHLPQDVSTVPSGWPVLSTYWDNSVKTKKNTIPATQPQQNLLTFTLYSFANFFFLTAFPWDMTIGISLRCPSFRLTCLSSPRFLFPVQMVISALFDFLCCFVQSRSSTPPVACEEILVALSA